MKVNLQKLLSRALNVLSQEQGQDLIEYALVAGMIALGSVVTMQSFRTTVANAFSTIGTKVTSNV